MRRVYGIERRGNGRWRKEKAELPKSLVDSAEKSMKFVQVFYDTHYKTTASGHRDAVKGHLDKI